MNNNVIIAIIAGFILCGIYYAIWITSLELVGKLFLNTPTKIWYMSWKRAVIGDVLLSGILSSFLASFGGGVLAMMIAISCAIWSFFFSCCIHSKYTIENKFRQVKLRTNRR